MTRRTAGWLVGAVSGLVATTAASAHASDKTDCIASFEEGQARRDDGQLTQAIQAFARCDRPVCPRSLQARCATEGASAASLLPSVVLAATDAAGSSLVDVTVELDGAPVATRLDGRALPLDPGLHTFRFVRPGLPPVVLEVPIKEGQRGQLVSARFPPLPATVVLAPVAAPIAAPPSPSPEGPTKLRAIGIGLGAAGVAGLAVGGVFGGLAFGKWSDAKAQCGASCTPGSAAYATKSTGETYGTVSTVAFVAGGALAVSGLTLFFVKPSASSSVALAPSLQGLRVSGTF